MANHDLPLNPFVGLRPFSTDESRLFFGRKQAARDLFAAVRISRFLLVSGESAIGKTSLVQAGLVPLLKEDTANENWKIIIFRPGEYPLRSLGQSILDFHEEGELELLHGFPEDVRKGGCEALLSYLREIAAPDERILIIIDQLEDIFQVAARVDNAGDLQRFVHLITELQEQEQMPVHVLALLRSDFLPDCEQYPGLAALIRELHFPLQPLPDAAVREAVEEPLRLYDVAFEPELTEKIIADLPADNKRLALLQFGLLEIWERWRESGEAEIRLSHFRNSGRIRAAVSLYADQVLDGLAGDERRIAEGLFRALAFFDEQGRITSHNLFLNDLPDLIEAPANDIAKIIDMFYSGGRSFLHISEDLWVNDLTISLSHESLVYLWDTCRQWINKEEKSRKQFKDFTAFAENYNTENWDLPVESAFSDFTQWRRKNKITDFWAQNYRPDYDSIADSFNRMKAQYEMKQKEKLFHSSMSNKIFRGLFFAAVFTVVIVFILFGQGFFHATPEPAVKTPVAAVVSDPPPLPLVPDSLQQTLPVLWSEFMQMPDSLTVLTPGRVSGQKPLQQPLVLPQPELAESTAVAAAAEDSLANARRARVAKQVQMFWNYGQNALKYNDWLRASHFFARCAGLSPDGQQVRNCVAQIRRMNQPVFLATEISPGSPVYGVKISHNETYLVTWSADNAARVWHIPDGSLTFPPLKHRDNIWGADFSPDDRYLLTWGADSTVRLWNVKDGSPAVKPLRHSDNVNGAEFSADGKTILSWSSDGTVRLWHTVNGVPSVKPLKHEDGEKNAVWSPDEKYVFTMCFDGTARLWRTRDGALIGGGALQQMPYSEEILGGEFSADSQTLLTWSSRSIRLWRTKDVSSAMKPIEIDYGMIGGARISSDGRYILSWDHYRYARVWRTVNATLVTEPLMHKSGVMDAEFIKNGNGVLTRSENGAVYLWDVRKGNIMSGPLYYRAKIESADFVEASNQLLIRGEDGSARLLNALNGGVQSIAMIHAGELNAAGFTPRRRYIYTWSRDSRSVKLWHYLAGDGQDIVPENIGNTGLRRSLPLLVEVLTGTGFDDAGNLRILTPAGWMEKRKQWEQLSGSALLSAQP